MPMNAEPTSIGEADGGATDDGVADDDTTGSGTGSAPVDDTASSAGFIDDTDAGHGIGIECSIWAQDCPAGKKCMPWANDGGGAWNATRCSPIADDPGEAGDPCTVEGIGLSGIDSCALGTMCWDVQPATREGVCHDLCTGSEEAPVCSNPGDLCDVIDGWAIAVCVPRCDPILQDCQPGKLCVPKWGGFQCQPDETGGMGGAGQFCDAPNRCAAGLVCTGTEVNDVVCDPELGACCIPWCEIGGPACANGEQCQPWFEPGDAHGIGYEHVGVCSTG